jgi:3-isopropylmalate dehydrogenase
MSSPGSEPHKNLPAKRGGSAFRIAVIPGDGIGREVIPEACKVLRVAAQAGNRKIELIELDWGAEKYLKEGVTLPAGAVEMFRNEFDAILLGALGDPRIPWNLHAAEILLGLRFKLDLFVNARPTELLDARFTPLRDRTERDIRFMVIRENTEGLYAGVGGFFKKGTPDEIAVQEDVNTRKGVERIIRYAYEYARRNGLKRVCMSDKSNALTFAHDLWQRVFAEVRREYSEIESRHLYIDTLAMEMVRDPSQFDVIVTCNLFGDIISDLGAQLAGGLGLAPSGNINPESTSLFEPVHGSAPNIAGKGIANPMGSVLAAAMMAEHLGWKAEAAAMNAAVRAALRERQVTQDLGGTLTTRATGDWLANFIAKRGPARAQAQN